MAGKPPAGRARGAAGVALADADAHTLTARTTSGQLGRVALIAALMAVSRSSDELMGPARARELAVPSEIAAGSRRLFKNKNVAGGM